MVKRYKIYIKETNNKFQDIGNMHAKIQMRILKQ